MKKTWLAGAIMALALGLTAKPAAAMSCCGGGEPDGAAPQKAEQKAVRDAAAGAVYTCPMHPEVTAKGPGECPECGMTLEKTETGDIQ